MTKASRLRTEPDPERDWNDAQRIKISADLISAAKIQLSFLATVDRSPCLYSHIDAITRATERYENYWLPMVARNTPERTSSGYPLVPPLDCAWIWHLHQLSPVQYANDCSELFGKIIECPMVTHDNRDDATKETQELWHTNYPSEPYCLDMMSFDSQEQNCEGSPSQFGKSKLQQKTKTVFRMPRVLNYDFVKAAGRQRSFYYQVSRPYMSETRFLFAAEMRYKAFLNLAINNSKKAEADKVFLVPTYDIDLMWHAHMRCPTSYAADTSRLMGLVFNHDDSDTDRSHGKKLDTGFRKTSELWETTYGVEYAKAGVLYRGMLPKEEPPPVSAKKFCGSGLLYEKKEVEFLKHVGMQDHLKKRIISEVRVAVIGVKNMKRNYRDLRLFLSLHKNSSSSFTFRAFDRYSCSPPLRKGASRFEEVTWQFHSELASTEALNVYVDLTRERNVFCSRERKYFKHSFILNWSEVLQSPTFSTDRYYSIMKSPNPRAPAVRLAVSSTPTMVGNHLLRTMPEPTDNLGNAVTDSKIYRQRYQQGKWLARSAYDHTGSVVYVIRIKDKLEAGQELSPLCAEDTISRSVYIHKGGWTTHRGPRYTTSVPAGPVAASAEQMQSVAGGWCWSLFNGQVKLTINLPEENTCTYGLSDGNSNDTVSLLRGRKLQYEVKSGKEEDEKNFVTLIRYRAENPLGIATALFNWKYGVFEISPEENVVLVLLLASAIKVSMFHSIRQSSKYNEKRLDKFAYAGVRTSHWGNTRQQLQEWWLCSNTSELYFAEGKSLPSEEAHQATIKISHDRAEAGGYAVSAAHSGPTLAAAGGGFAVSLAHSGPTIAAVGGGCGGGCGGCGGGCGGS
ncbi:hypothetical protein Mapa_010165 [Marchantia paleacea]|nr:hypothetical protein Mapa_010165 [Marchantia paleacea]